MAAGAVGLAVAYGALLFLVRGYQLALVDAAIGDLRVLAGAQSAYAELNGGLSEGELSRLPGLSGEPLSVVWSRPGRRFLPGPRADHPPTQASGAAVTSVHGFLAIADASLGKMWGRAALLGETTAAFCADARGYVCELRTAPAADQRVCPEDCRVW